ncbi:MAG: hypothetical protein C4518_08450 [Desulfobacteraceae bacterium]|nr:MAG: hypothetical protein C4518_08450 [Desulfobacteraceae bacterium]
MMDKKFLYEKMIDQALDLLQEEAGKDATSLEAEKTLHEIVCFCAARLLGKKPYLDADVIKAAIIDFDIDQVICDLWSEIECVDSIGHRL